VTGAHDPRPLARGLLAALAGALPATAVLPVLLADDLPDRLATHWTLDGRADAATSPATLAGLVLLLTVPCAAVLLAAASTRRARTPGTWPALAGTAALLGVVLAGLVPLTVSLDRAGTSWQATAAPAWWQLLALVGAALAVAAGTARAASTLPTVAEEVPTTEALDVPSHARVSWSGSATARWPLALSAALVAAGAVLALSIGHRWAGLLLVAAGLGASALSHVQVYADQRGLTVAYGPFGWPRTRLPLADIASVAPIHVRPAEWGGWGYRGSLRVLRRAAVVLRTGPGIRVDLRDGRVFAVTVDDAATGAAVLERERVSTG
jgi:hypothetical protein